MTSQRYTVRIARWSATHPWRAIVGWIVFVAVCLAVGSYASARGATSADYRIGEAGHAQEIMARGGLTERSVENVLIAARQAPLDRAAAESAAADIARRMRTLSAVAEVAAPVLAPDGTALRVPVTMTTDGASSEDAVGALLDQTAAVAEGIIKSAGVVTSAAIVMVSVFTGFVFGGLLEIKQVGFGLAVGILLDAFVIRILILPAAMTLLGRLSWWPVRLPERPVIAAAEPVQVR